MKISLDTADGCVVLSQLLREQYVGVFRFEDHYYVLAKQPAKAPCSITCFDLGTHALREMHNTTVVRLVNSELIIKE